MICKKGSFDAHLKGKRCIRKKCLTLSKGGQWRLIIRSLFLSDAEEVHKQVCTVNTLTHCPGNEIISRPFCRSGWQFWKIDKQKRRKKIKKFVQKRSAVIYEGSCKQSFLFLNIHPKNRKTLVNNVNSLMETKKKQRYVCYKY